MPERPRDEPFPDWDNPEDLDDGAPEGYYDDPPEAEDEDEGYVPEPGDVDYDLSEAAGYSNWEPPERRGIVPQWTIVAISIVLILAMLIPVLIRIN